jgi:hypothetical protein
VTRRWVAAALIGGMIAPLCTTPGPAYAAPRPKDRVVIDVVKVNGSGCKKGTATIAVSPDNEAFTVTYSGYLVQVGADADKKEARKDCKLTVRVGVPKGFTYAIDRTDYRGYANLQGGATGKESASYYFHGGSHTATLDHPITGPFDGYWQATDLESAIYEPCGKKRALNIDTELQLEAGSSDPTSTSMMAMDSTDGSIKTTYHLVWKTC